MEKITSCIAEISHADGAPTVVLQPRISRSGLDWLNRIMLAYRRDTWSEAAELVLSAIAAEPRDPVNAWTFSASDVPRKPRFVNGWSAQAGVAIRFFPDASICVRLPGDTARYFVRLTGLGLTPSRAAAAALRVAARLDPTGGRYMPEGRP